MAYRENLSGYTGIPVLIKTITASTTTNIDFTTGITGYKYYILQMYDVIFSDNNVTLSMQFSTNSGGAWQNSNYDYELIYNFAASIIANIANGTAQTSIQIASALGNGAANGNNATIYLYSLGNAALNKKVNINFTGTQQGVATGINWTGMGGWGTTTAVNGVRMFLSSGTFLSGTFNLFGVT
jgi:hypothetical protein